MNPERWTRVRGLLERAFEVPEAERERFVIEAAGDDLELRRRVLALLAHDSEGPDLEPPGHGTVVERWVGSSASLAAGAQVGEFTVERELASGGMGVVYLARQSNPSRTVALKVMRHGLAAPGALRRFQVEVEILARLKHPNVAQIHAAGIHREGSLELPWFAMELVEEARGLTDFAREQELSLERRLELFAKVCDAVHSGHQRGVVHRDLKPANVLVDATGEPKVIDFGVALATASDLQATTLLGAPSEIAGTLAYMSPEQAAGDVDRIDVRTDVYSLGALLYELVCGRPPHDLQGASLPKVLRILTEAAPPPPRRVVPGLPEDLEIVLLKALAATPEGRYASASDLAGDLRRFLARQPIEARRPTAVYQLSLFARRHRGLAAAFAVTLVVVVAATLVSLDFAWRSRRAEEAEAQARSLAEDLFGEALERNYRWVDDVVDRVRLLPGSTDISLEMAERSVEDLEALAERAGDDPRTRFVLAQALWRLGELQGDHASPSLGDVERARATFERARDLASDLVLDGSGDDAELLALLARCERELGEGHLYRGEVEPAIPLLEACAATLEDVLRLEPASVSHRSSLAHVQHLLGNARGMARDFEVALEHFETALAIGAELLREEPGNATLRMELAGNTGKRGMTLFHLGREQEGLDELREEVRQLEQVIASSPDYAPARVMLAETRYILCRFQRESGALDRAREDGRLAVADLEALRRREPKVPKYARSLSQAYFELGLVFEDLAVAEGLAGASSDETRGRWREARAWFDRANTLLEGLQRTGGLPLAEAGHLERCREKLALCDERLAGS